MSERALSTISSRGSGEPPDSNEKRQIASLIGRLLVHYWTENMPATMREAQAQDWLQDLGEFGPEIVSIACGEWRRRPGAKRPTPGDIRALCIAEQINRREGGLLLAHPDLSDDDERRVADKWARSHGYNSIEHYQMETYEGRGAWLMIGKTRRYFPGRKVYEPPARAPTAGSSAQAMGITATEFTPSPERMRTDLAKLIGEQSDAV